MRTVGSPGQATLAVPSGIVALSSRSPGTRGLWYSLRRAALARFNNATDVPYRLHDHALQRGFRELRALRIIRGVWRPSKVKPTVALPPTSNVSGPRPASVAAVEMNAHCGGVTGQRRHHHRRADLREHFIERSSSASPASFALPSQRRCLARTQRFHDPDPRQHGVAAVLGHQQKRLMNRT
jgi:hypothetical protein